MPAFWPEGPESARTVCCRLDAFPGDPHALADRMLTPVERAYWLSMRAVEKRRREWLLGRVVAKDAVRILLERKLNLHLTPAEIEIEPDAYGRPRVAWSGTPVAVSIAHSEGTALALAALDTEGLLLGIDLESLSHRTEDFETVAFSEDERRLLDALPADARRQWALRMWCAKETVGKALGRGLSAGLLAFHITSLPGGPGPIELELRDAALAAFPQLRGQKFPVYTCCESGFVYSAMIYQQGVARMTPSRQQILDYLLQKMADLTQDWDYPDPVRPESLLFTELGFESLDAVVLCTAIQEHYQTPMPFAELLAEIGQQQRDLSINELTDFVHTHLSAVTANGTGRIQ